MPDPGKRVLFSGGQKRSVIAMKTFKKHAAVFVCLAALCITMLPVFAVANSDEPSEFGDWECFYEVNKSVIHRHAHPEKLMNLPICRQTKSYTDGAACVLSVMRYAKYDFDICESDLAAALAADEDAGVLSSHIVSYLNSVKYKTEEDPFFNASLRNSMTLSDLKAEIDQGHPVICAIQAWNWDEDEEYSMELDYTNEWECGHWAVAVGYNDNNIFFMDPSTSANYTYIPNDKMMERWHDYEKINGEPKDLIQAGIVVEIRGSETPDGERFKDAFYGLQRNAHPRKIMKLPLFWGSTSNTSGLASMMSVMRFAKYDFDIRENNLASALSAGEEEPAESKMVRFLNAVSYNEKNDPCFNAEFKQLMTPDELKAELDRGHPVICAVQTEGHIGEWEYGHWAVAIGYDTDNIFFMDPSSPAGYTYIPNGQLSERWHAFVGADGNHGTEYEQAGIVVEICGEEEPDGVRYRDAFYGLM